VHGRGWTCSFPVVVNSLITTNSSNKKTSMGKVNTISVSQHKVHSVVFTDNSHKRGSTTKVHDSSIGFIMVPNNTYIFIDPLYW
jgi:hypothetical protein